MIHSFRYRIDRRTMVYTALTLAVFAVVAVLLFSLYTGGYLSAWFSSFVLAVMALMVLSVPRRIVVLDDTLEIQCISDITEIDLREIASLRRAGKREMRRMVPVFGASGFFGYYGKYFDFKEFEIVTLYASEWRNFVEITDIYDSRIYVSCREADRLIHLVRQAKAALELRQADAADDEDSDSSATQ